MSTWLVPLNELSREQREAVELNTREHRLIGRLELYARMLLWMAWAWHADGRQELSRSAFALAAQLSDQQYAVPSHPFPVGPTTRSLLAAQAVLLGIDGSSTDE